ncbi:MAG: substrate-binding domain-containing protein [Clostridiales bacterium]|nr:substrate-binding domain-containing protein [Clostridiales bacterium]
MKKIVALILALAMVLTCAFALAEEKKTEYNFYGLYKSESMYFVNEAASIEKTIAAWAEENGVSYKWHYLSSDGDAEKCLTTVDTAIADSADAIFICVPDQTMSEAVVEKCNAAGVLVVAVDDGLIDADGNKIAPWFGIDAYNIGYAAGEWMADYAKENNLLDDPACALLYMTMDTVSSCVPRTEGEKQAWADKVGDALSDRTYFCDYLGADEAEAYANATAVIAAHPEITKWLVMSASETGSSTAAAALEEAGLVEGSCVNALGTDATALQWDEGNFEVIRSSAYFSGKVVGQAAALAVCDYLLNGTEIPAEYATPAVIVTPENYKDIML